MHGKKVQNLIQILRSGKSITKHPQTGVLECGRSRTPIVDMPVSEPCKRQKVIVASESDASSKKSAFKPFGVETAKDNIRPKTLVGSVPLQNPMQPQIWQQPYMQSLPTLNSFIAAQPVGEQV